MSISRNAARTILVEAKWLTFAGLLVSFHRLAVGFYLSDADSTHASGVALVVLGGIAALVLTGAQMVLASTLATVHDRLLELAWWTLLLCAVTIMTASTLASMHGIGLAAVLQPAWIRAHLPAVLVSAGLSIAIEVSLASIRRASALVQAQVDDRDDLDLEDHERAELAVQRELAAARQEGLASEKARHHEPQAKSDDGRSTRECPWCGWSVTKQKALSARNAIRAHQRFCGERPNPALD